MTPHNSYTSSEDYNPDLTTRSIAVAVGCMLHGNCSNNNTTIVSRPRPTTLVHASSTPHRTGQCVSHRGRHRGDGVAVAATSRSNKFGVAGCIASPPAWIACLSLGVVHVGIAESHATTVTMDDAVKCGSSALEVRGRGGLAGGHLVRRGTIDLRPAGPAEQSLSSRSNCLCFG